MYIASLCGFFICNLLCLFSITPRSCLRNGGHSEVFMPPALPPPSSPLLRITTGSGHAGVKGKYDRADRLAGKASGLLLGRPEVLRNLRHSLGAESQGHHPIDRLEERGVERGSARRSSLQGRERAIVSQTNTGNVSKATMGKLLRD